MLTQLIKTGILAVAAVQTIGCGSGAKQEQSRESAAQAYQAGLSALKANDCQSAVDSLTVALEGGWLGYSTIDAYTQRAVAQAKLGNFDAAQADLAIVEQGGDTADVFAVRSYILAKQGKQAESNALWNQARRLNPSVERIND